MTSFLINLDFSDVEYAAYENAVVRRRMARFNQHPMRTIATGFAAATIGAAILLASRIVPDVAGAPVAALLFAAFWIGIWTPHLWIKHDARKIHEALRAEHRRTWANATLLATLRYLVFRRTGVRGFWRPSAIRGATVEDGLVLLWLGSESALPIPVRLLDPSQQTQLLSFASGTSQDISQR
jgi:hypothetical protein